MISREDLALVVDLGTSGLKVGLAQLDGTLLATRHASLSTTWLEGDGATQDANEWWRLVVALSQDLLKVGLASRLRAVVVTGQYASVVPVSEDLEAVGPCVMWMDGRGARRVRERVGGPVAGYSPRAAWTLIRRTGGAPSLNGTDAIGGLLHLWHDEREVLTRARWLLEPVDFLVARFSGDVRTTHASMFAWWLTDNRRLTHFAYDQALLRLLGVSSERLAPLVAFGSIAGTVSRAASVATGLPEGLPVLVGLPDLHAAALGAGTNVLGGPAHLALSTTSWISAPVAKKKTDIAHSIATTPGLDQSSYLVVDNHDVGAMALEWVGHALDGSGAIDYEALLSEAASAPPGSGDVLFTPWLNGERSPVDRHDARGGFHHLSLQTSRADLLRATLEGVAYNSRWLLHYVERFVGASFASLRVLGGGANSPLWCQIHADVTQRPVEQLRDPMVAQLRGGALAAGRTLGVISDDELPSLAPIAHRYEPHEATKDRYERLYQEFPRLMKSQSSMFRRLR